MTPKFTNEIMAAPLPKGIKMPNLHQHDGSGDRLDYVEPFWAVVVLHAAPDALMCWAFLATL